MKQKYSALTDILQSQSTGTIEYNNINQNYTLKAKQKQKYQFETIQIPNFQKLNIKTRKNNFKQNSITHQVRNKQKYKQKTNKYTIQQVTKEDIFSDKSITNNNKSIYQLLYKQANTKSAGQFYHFCDKVLLQKQLVVSNLHGFHTQKLNKTNILLMQIQLKLDILNFRLASQKISYQHIKKIYTTDNSFHQQFDEICLKLKRIDQLHNINNKLFNCIKPCCQLKDRQIVIEQKIKLKIKPFDRKTIHYKTQTSQQYFSRYYRKSNFNQNKIYSISRTKGEQMQDLQKKYIRKKQRQRKLKVRCLSLLTQVN